MTRKDFELIAHVLRQNKSDLVDAKGWNPWALTVHSMASALATANANFDRSRFLKACGL